MATLVWQGIQWPGKQARVGICVLVTEILTLHSFNSFRFQRRVSAAWRVLRPAVLRLRVARLRVSQAHQHRRRLCSPMIMPCSQVQSMIICVKIAHMSWIAQPVPTMAAQWVVFGVLTLSSTTLVLSHLFLQFRLGNGMCPMWRNLIVCFWQLQEQRHSMNPSTGTQVCEAKKWQFFHSPGPHWIWTMLRICHRHDCHVLQSRSFQPTTEFG